MSSAAGRTAAPRLRPEQRREVLLDAARQLLLERGPSGVTMEGMAARCGVNKALPYRHFQNADDALAHVWARHMTILGDTVLSAMAPATSPRERMEAAVHAYFSVVKEHGAILARLNGTAAAERGNAAVGSDSFIDDLLVDAFDVDRSAVRAVASVFLAALNGAAGAWAERLASRRTLEQLVVGAAFGAIEASRQGT